MERTQFFRQWAEVDPNGKLLIPGKILVTRVDIQAGHLVFRGVLSEKPVKDSK